MIGFCGSGCFTAGRLPSTLLQQIADLWTKSWRSYSDQRRRAPQIQTFQVRFHLFFFSLSRAYQIHVILAVQFQDGKNSIYIISVMISLLAQCMTICTVQNLIAANCVIIWFTGTDMLVNLLRWVKSKQLHNCQAIGYMLVTALNGCGILSMQGINPSRLLFMHFILPHKVRNTLVICLFWWPFCSYWKQQTTQLAHKDASRVRLGEEVHLWKGLQQPVENRSIQFSSYLLLLMLLTWSFLLLHDSEAQFFT
jgi:hypothetical protein